MTHTTRRESLQMAALAALSACCAPKSGLSAGPPTAPVAASPSSLPPGAWLLWYAHPAREWVEALPIGTGRLGAMVFGGVESERLQLNEDTLWSGYAKSSVPHPDPGILADI